MHAKYCNAGGVKSYRTIVTACKPSCQELLLLGQRAWPTTSPVSAGFYRFSMRAAKDFPMNWGWSGQRLLGLLDSESMSENTIAGKLLENV